MKTKLFILTIITATNANVCGMKIVERLKNHYYQSTTQSVSTYKAIKKEKINKQPSNPTANTTEAHACNVINILMEDLRTKKLKTKNVESCIIQIARSKESKRNVKKILEKKYPELYKKTYIEYTSELPEGCHAVLEALVKHNYEPEKAKL